jgi:hypothetical protein
MRITKGEARETLVSLLALREGLTEKTSGKEDSKIIKRQEMVSNLSKLSFQIDFSSPFTKNDRKDKDVGSSFVFKEISCETHSRQGGSASLASRPHQFFVIDKRWSRFSSPLVTSER